MNTLWRSMLKTSSLKDRVETALQIMCAVSNAASAQLYLVAGDGLELEWMGAHGVSGSACAPERADIQRRFDEACRRAQEVDEMQTGDTTDEMPTAAAFDVAGCAYELLLLDCLHRSQRAVAGALVLERGAEIAVNPQRARWLQTLAEHFLEHGDTPGRVGQAG